jgi:Uma2 family endonuclease
MAKVPPIGPRDHGRCLTWEEYAKSAWEEGYIYELLDGRLYVTARHELPENRVEDWLADKLRGYEDDHPESINAVFGKACVFVPGRRDLTCLAPDQTAYRGFPHELPLKNLDWKDVSPILVLNVVAHADPEKDLVRNVDLYYQVPTIQEYWAVDTRENPERPILRVHRRHARGWQILEYFYGELYTSPVFPGLEVLVNPRT